MIEVHIGDCRKLIHKLEDKSINAVVTSPPYWGLRDYKTEAIVFDGAPDCEHEWTGEQYKIMQPHKDNSGGFTNNRINTRGTQAYANGSSINASQGSFCSICGAWRGQLGLEPTPELYLKHLLDFFNDVKPKLKDEGNCFVNLGDSYSSTGANNQPTHTQFGKPTNPGRQTSGHRVKTLPPKCLCLIPQRFAIGMVERGWLVRNEIIWHKVNHMPESVTDRLTKAHEVVWHFVKQGRYYYNLDAIREPHKAQEKRPMGIIRSREWGYNGKYEGNTLHETFGSPRARTQRNRSGNNGQKGNDMSIHWGEDTKGKNPGDVWSINMQPFSGAHFAVFPLALVRRSILAGCPKGGTVLDPFTGSGTVGEFCRHNDRNAILFELQPEYKKLIDERAMINIPPLKIY